MRAIRLVPLVLFFLLLGGQAIFVENAYAFCCGCTWCKIMVGCSCPGQDGCAWYPCSGAFPDDSSLLQAKTVTENGSFGVSRIHQPLRPSVFNSDSTNGMRLAGSGQCTWNRFVQKFFQNAESRLKFELDFLKYEATRGNEIVAYGTLGNDDK